MENNIKRIEEEIRQYKLYKIQIDENRIREYSEVFDVINESVVMKFSKNASSNILRVVLFIITVVLLLFGIGLLFPEQILNVLEKSGEVLSESDKSEFINELRFFGYTLILLSTFFGVMSILLKKNIRKRNTIFELSKLLKEVIEYMNENVSEDKRKYEYFVDGLADIENRMKEPVINDADKDTLT